jgi:hypothetical protein
MKEKLRFLGLDVHAETIALRSRSRMAKCEVWERFRSRPERDCHEHTASIAASRAVWSLDQQGKT